MKHLIKILILVSVIIFTGCEYYDYGVNKDKYTLPYRTYYYDEKDKKYDFNTVIFSLKNLEHSNNYTFFNIYISHMVKKENSYVSTIRFDNTKNIKLKIFPDSIKLFHKNDSNKLIRHNEIIKDFNSTYHQSYKKTYDEALIKGSLIEVIYFEFELNGKIYIVNKEFLVDKALHYTFWDVLMGV